MCRIRHSRQCGHFLSLASCCDEYQFFIGITVHFIYGYQSFFRNRHISQFFRYLDDRLHTSALQDHFSSVFISGIHDLLDSVHIGCKGGHNNSVCLVFCKKRIKSLCNLCLRRSESGTDGIGTVAHDCQHAFLPQSSHSLQVNSLSEQRGIIHFKIPCVENNPCGCMDCQSGCPRYAVVCSDKFDSHLAKIDLASLFHYSAFRLFQQFCFLQLMLYESHCQHGGIDRHIDLRKDIGQRTDMVFMSVGDHKPFHLLLILN